MIELVEFTNLQNNNLVAHLEIQKIVYEFIFKIVEDFQFVSKKTQDTRRGSECVCVYLEEQYCVVVI